jgi:hypothetical protein
MKLDGKPPIKLGDAYFGMDIDIKSQLAYKLDKIKYGVTLLKYDKDLKVVKEVKLENGERVYGPFEPMIKKINDKIFFLYYQHTGEDDNIKLMSCEIDPITLKLSAPEELLSLVQKNISLQQALQMTSSYKFELMPSPDLSKTLVLWSSGVNNQIYFSVLGKDFKKIRSANETISKESKIEVINACVDNIGNVFISYNNSKRKLPHIILNKADSKSSDFELNIGSGEVYEAYVFPSINDNNIVVTGTYREGTDRLAGVFSQVINVSSSQPGAATKTIFPKELIEEFDGDGWAETKAKNYGLSILLYITPVLLGDGTINLAGEFRKVEMGTKTSFMIAGDIINIHFKKDGVVFSRIPKVRVSAGSTIGDSFYPVAYKNQVIIFYNDHESNVKQDITKTPSRSDNYRNSVLVAAAIQPDGTVKREILIDLSKEDYLPVAETLQRLSQNSILIPIRKVKGFGKIGDDFKWGAIEIK